MGGKDRRKAQRRLAVWMRLAVWTLSRPYKNLVGESGSIATSQALGSETLSCKFLIRNLQKASVNERHSFSVS